MGSTRDTQQEGQRQGDGMYSTTTSSIAEIGNSISNMAGSMNEIKNKVNTVSAGDVVRDIRDSAYSITMGSKQAEESTGLQDCDPRELKMINDMPKERIAEFLREKHKSDAIETSKKQ